MQKIIFYFFFLVLIFSCHNDEEKKPVNLTINAHRAYHLSYKLKIPDSAVNVWMKNDTIKKVIEIDSYFNQTIPVRLINDIDTLYIGKNEIFVPDSLNATHTITDKKKIDRLLKILNDLRSYNNDDIECHYARNWFYFFNENDEIAGESTICFECRNIRFDPDYILSKNGGLNKEAADSLKGLLTEAAIRIGGYKL